MWDTKGLIQQFSKHEKLNIVVDDSHGKVVVPEGLKSNIFLPHRMAAYLFVFVISGKSRHIIDMKEISVNSNKVLFILPHQIHCVQPEQENDRRIIKLAFDQECLSLLPTSFSFLLDPLHNPVLKLTSQDLSRVLPLLRSIEDLLTSQKKDTGLLLLAYLNTLMTELNFCYFGSTGINKEISEMLSLYCHFKKLVEQQLKCQPTVYSLAQQLAISESKLYKAVMHLSGLSPKAYLLQQTILEAQRILIYKHSSVKEVAFELGFSDPDYFSRLFKRSTGKTVTRYLEQVADLSGRHLD